MAEYLESVRVLYETDRYTVLSINTNKGNYIAKLPYTVAERQKVGRIQMYSLSIKDWCRLRHIIVKDYIGFKKQNIRKRGSNERI